MAPPSPDKRVLVDVPVGGCPFHGLADLGSTGLATAGGILYNLSRLSSSVEVFAVSAGGALTLIQTRTVPHGASQEGIVAS